MATYPQLCKVTDRKVLGLDNLYKKKKKTTSLFSCIACFVIIYLPFLLVCNEEVKEAETIMY